MTDLPEEKQIVRVSQAEAAYTPLSKSNTKACANCRWFSSDNMCLIVENYPEDILPTGLSNRWEAKPTPEDITVSIEADSVTVVAVEPMMMGSMELKEETPEPVQDKAGAVLSRSNYGLIKQALTSIKDVLRKAGFGDDEDDEEKSLTTHGSSFKVFKSGDKYLWTAVWSNNFKDREGEILSQKAHDRYVARLDAGLVPMPELWFWHTKGTAHGKALWIGRIGHLMRAVGEFDDSPIARKFVEHYRKSKVRYGVSHGFTYPKWAKKDNVYEDYNTFEISPLPYEVAANPITGFEELIEMPMSDAKREHLVKIVGPDLAEKLVAQDEDNSKALEIAGVGFKDFGDIPAAEEAAKDAEQNEVKSTLGQAFLAMIEAQAQTMEDVKALKDESATTIKALTDRLDALAQENKDLREKMAMTPRASQAEKTVTNDTELKDQIEQKASEYDDVWASVGLKVKKDKVNE